VNEKQKVKQPMLYVCVLAQAGTDAIIFKIFSPKKISEKLAF
jgi:hypothetical protein